MADTARDILQRQKDRLLDGVHDTRRRMAEARADLVQLESYLVDDEATIIDINAALATLADLDDASQVHGGDKAA